jgi:lambda family phage portal protein
MDNNSAQDRGANNAIESAWRRWSGVCDVAGRQHFRDFCSSLVESMPSDGEFLVRIVTGADAQNEFNFALQRIDVDRIDTNYNSTIGGNTVIMGVEINSARRPVALHIFEGHPADGQRSSRRRVRIPAEDLIHGFKATQADQVRGIPWMAPGMLSLHHLGGFGLAALLAAEHGANHYGFFKTPDGQAPTIGSVDGDTQQNIMTTQPGVYDTLPVGVDFQPHESKYPNEVFGPFVKTTLQRIASGWGVAYHGLANDLEGVSFSSIRSGTLEERDRWSAEQEWFIQVFLERIYPQWLRSALLSNAIVLDNGSALPGTKYSKFAAHEWQPRRWDWVDPKKDMEAKIMAVRAGLMAPQDIASSMGYDFEDVLIAIAAANKLADTLGVNLTAYDPAPGVIDPADEKAKPDTTENTTAAKYLESNTRAITTLAAAMGAFSKREQPAPVINVNNEGARHEIHNHLAPTPVEVRNVVNIPETTVNVTAELPAQERAEATQINVQVMPTPVTVNNTHPERAVQTVQRDANDEIIGTTTTYE